MGFTYRNFVPFYIQVVFADIVYLIDIYYVRAVNLNKALPVHFFFEVLDGIVGNILFIERYKLYVVAHAFNE
jgi:hypothetical protein